MPSVERAAKTRGISLTWAPIWVWLIVMAVAALWPLLIFAMPAGQDTPNHLARAFILLNPDNAALASHYIIDWKPVPNLAWDGFAVLAGQLLPLVLVLKLFMISGMALTLGGVFLLNRALYGRFTWTPLLAVPFLFHAGFIRGFLSFNFAIGLALIACAIWASLDERRWLTRLVIGTAMSAVLYFSHLIAWGIYGIFILGLKLSELWILRREGHRSELGGWTLRLMRDGLQAVIPLVLFAIAFLSTDQGKSVTYLAELPPPYIRIAEVWLFLSTGRPLPGVFLLAAMAVLFAIGLRSRILRFDARFAAPIAMLAVLFFVTPNQIYGTYYVAWRIGLGAVFIAIASLVPSRAQRVNMPSAAFYLASALAVTLGLTTWESVQIRNTEAGRSDFMKLIQHVPVGDTLYMLHEGMRNWNVEADRIGLYHIGSEAVIARQALVQSIFANPTQQPIGHRDPRYALYATNGEVFLHDIILAYRKHCLSLENQILNFDWVLVHGPNPEFDRLKLPLWAFRFVGAEGDFRLYGRKPKFADQRGEPPRGCDDSEDNPEEDAH